MKTITKEQLNTLCKNGQAIDEKGGYPAVVIHPDNTITKIWARKRGLISTSRIIPYSTRFVRNAKRLAERGINTPEIMGHFRLERSHVHVVTYRSLPGNSIRELLKKSPDQVDIEQTCRFIASLHDLGIYYRTIHLGNIIRLPDGDHGLIDFTDVRFSSRPLSLKRRAANLSIYRRKRYAEDMDLLNRAGLPDMVTCYLDTMQITGKDREIFLEMVRRHTK